MHESESELPVINPIHSERKGPVHKIAFQGSDLAVFELA
jgi:hypothetical protein